MVALYFVRAMLTVHLVLAIRVGYTGYVRAGTFEGVVLEDFQQSFDTSQQQHLGWYLVVSTIFVITIAVAAALYTWHQLRSTLHFLPAGQSAWGLAGSSSIPGKPGTDMHGFTVYGHLQSRADHSGDTSTPRHVVNLMIHHQKEEASPLLFSGEGGAMHSKNLQSKLLPQSSSPQADGIATAVYRMAAAQEPANSLMLPILWSPKQEAMAQVILAHARVARALSGYPDEPWQTVSSPEACTLQESDSTPPEGHKHAGKRGEQEAAAPVQCPDEAQSEAAAASASKSKQHASLQPETLLMSQSPAQPASTEICIQARVLPPTCGTDTIAEQDTCSGPAGAADSQNQSNIQVSRVGNVKKPRKRWWRKLLCGTCVKA